MANEIDKQHVEEVDAVVSSVEVKFLPYDHHPVDDEKKPLTMDEFVRACATSLFEYRDAFKDVDTKTNPWVNEKHAFN